MTSLTLRHRPPGLLEVPYVQAPCDVSQIAAGSKDVPDPRLPCRVSGTGASVRVRIRPKDVPEPRLPRHASVYASPSGEHCTWHQLRGVGRHARGRDPVARLGLGLGSKCSAFWIGSAPKSDLEVVTSPNPTQQLAPSLTLTRTQTLAFALALSLI